MKRKNTITIVCYFIVLFIICGCSKKTAISNSNDNLTTESKEDIEYVENTETDKENVSEYNIIGVLWTVKSILYKDGMIDLEDNSVLYDLYDTTVLTFEKDGTYSYIDAFITKGTYKEYKEKGDVAFILKTEEVMEYSSEKGEFIGEKVKTPSYYIVTLDEDGLMKYEKFDPITDKVIKEDITLLFKRS